MLSLPAAWEAPLPPRQVGAGVNSKGLDVCNGLERDRACSLSICRDGRKPEGHDGLDGLALGWDHLQHTHGLRARERVHGVASDVVEEA